MELMRKHEEEERKKREEEERKLQVSGSVLPWLVSPCQCLLQSVVHALLNVLWQMNSHNFCAALLPILQLS
jgi:hypothetical protein